MPLSYELTLARDFVFDGSSSSASAWLRSVPAAFRVPEMETGTVALQLWESEDPPTVADADATFVKVKSGGSIVTIEAADDEAIRDQVDPGLHFGIEGEGWRLKLVAVDSGGSAVDQVAQVVRPVGIGA